VIGDLSVIVGATPSVISKDFIDDDVETKLFLASFAFI